MRKTFANGLATLSLVLAFGVPESGAVCTPVADGKLRCAIQSLADCDQVSDYPYARNLFCPAAFSAVQGMVSRLSAILGAAGPSSSEFVYYQTVADPDGESQTTIGCLDTPAPWGSSIVEGAGTPLCHLVAHATSMGPVAPDPSSPNPVPEHTRGFPGYFDALFTPSASFPLLQFRPGPVFDPVVESLGAAGHDGFVQDYPLFSPTGLYDPEGWQGDPEFRGISGGGGGGWGGEIVTLGPRGKSKFLLTFGGGGGGGMTTFRDASNVALTKLGAGGGGGMQFGRSYRVRGRKFNGLGLGAGMDSGETEVQYSYNDYRASGRPPRPVNQYNPELIGEYATQLGNLRQQLTTRFGNGRTIVLEGGGGMGGGSEYLMENGQEYEPHALSTQAGFEFRYEFRTGGLGNARGSVGEGRKLQADQEDFYALLGEDFRVANAQALDECGGDYSNYACICPRSHALVICLAGQQLGDPDEIPSWLQEQHCPLQPSTRPIGGFTSYQQFLLENAEKPGSPCARVLREYFTAVNTPDGGPEDE